MKMHDECIPCLVSQVIKTAHLTGAQDRETLCDMLPPLSLNGLKWGLLSQET